MRGRHRAAAWASFARRRPPEAPPRRRPPAPRAARSQAASRCSPSWLTARPRWRPRVCRSWCAGREGEGEAGEGAGRPLSDCGPTHNPNHNPNHCRQVSVYLTDFYVSLGAPLAFLTFFTAAARSLDVLTDPVMGWLSDRTRSRFGRRRPYQLAGCALYGALFCALFTPPAAILATADAGHLAPGDPAVRRVVAWFAGTYFFFYLADSFCNVPYEALGPELTDDYTERSRVFFVAKLFNQAGMLAAAALPAIAAFALRARGSDKVAVSCDSLAFGAVPDARSYELLPPAHAAADGACAPSRVCAGGGGAYCFAPESLTSTIQYEAPIGKVVAACARALAAATGPNPPPEPPCAALTDCAPGASDCAKFTRYTLASLTAQRGAYAVISAGFGEREVERGGKRASTRWALAADLHHPLARRRPTPSLPRLQDCTTSWPPCCARCASRSGRCRRAPRSACRSCRRCCARLKTERSGPCWPRGLSRDWGCRRC